MTTREKIEQDLIAATKARQAETLSTLRLLRSAIKNAEIEKMATLEEKDVLAVISKEARKIKDGLDSYESAKREDLAAQARKELALLEGYLPAGLSDDELRAIVSAQKEKLGVQSEKDFGKLMGAVMQAAAGRADGTKVQQMVREALA